VKLRDARIIEHNFIGIVKMPQLNK